jgi:hypothetical protein
VSRAEHAGEFTAALLGPHGDSLAGHYLTVWSVEGDGNRTRWIPADQPESIASAVVEVDSAPGTRAVYLGIALTASAGESDERMVADPNAKRGVMVAGLLGVIADIDIAGPGHDDKRTLPPDETAARRIIDSMGLSPSLVVHSGGGLHAYWLFDEPWIFGSTGDDLFGGQGVDQQRAQAERADAAELLWSWVTTLRVNARGIGGWWVDPVGDLPRVLRVPGSTNRKQDPARPVLVAERDDNNRYSVDDLWEHVADKAVLEQYKLAGKEIADGLLAGVDVTAVWARATSPAYASRNYLPPWLEMVIDVDADMGDGKIGATFAGKRAEFNNDASTYDAALARLLADAEIEPEMICEAVMCRRLRTGEKIDKVDPRTRVDYLNRTVGRFIAESRIKKARREANYASAAQTLAAATAEPESEPEPAALTLVQEQPPTVTDADREPIEGAPVDAPDIDRVDDDGVALAEPDKPAGGEQAALAKATSLLALPEGFALWRVEWREGRKTDEMRLWVYRTPATTPPRGLDTWKPGSAVPTRWHPKASYEEPGKVCGHLLHDLHLNTGQPQRGWRGDGVPLLYEVLHEVKMGTPRGAIRAAVRDYLAASPPIELFSVARDAGHPWLIADAVHTAPSVAVPVPTLRRHLAQMGEVSVLTPEEVVTMAAAMGCGVRSGVVVTEGGRPVRDARTWLVIAPGLLSHEEWTDVRLAVANYREQQAGAHLRAVP